MEIWKDVVGYEGLYQVSNLGRVKSFKYLKEKILKPSHKDNGYLFITLCKNGVMKRYYIHRLVASAFIPNPQNKPTVNHIDCDRTNNCVENLEWNTYAENNDYALKMMKDKGINKKNNKESKPVIQYDLDGNFIKEYPSYREAQRQTGITTIYVACKGINQKTAGGYKWKYKEDIAYKF